MMTLDQLMALPQAGAAAIAAHRWCATAPDAGRINAFDLLTCLAGLPGLSADNLRCMLDVIAKGDADAASMLGALWSMVGFEIAATLCKSTGVPVVIDRRGAVETAVADLLDRIQQGAKGGAAC